MIGTACDEGELFTAVMQKDQSEVEKIAKFYDFIEVQPPALYQDLMDRELIRDNETLTQIYKRLIDAGKSANIPVIATGNAHYLFEHDAIARKILIASQPGNPLNRSTLPEAHFRTTDEMLDDFHFLGEEKAYEIVVTNTNELADKIEKVVPIKDKLFTPRMDGANEEIRELSYSNAKKLYGEDLPQIVIDRLEKELDKLQSELDRVDKKLSNENFVNKAPEKIINEEKEKQQHYQEKYNGVKSRIEQLKA